MKETGALTGEGGQLEPAAEAGFKRHACVSCDRPIATYGLLRPCRHVFCLACAAAMRDCGLCGGGVESVDVTPHGEKRLFVSSATLQGFQSASCVRYVHQDADLRLPLFPAAVARGSHRRRARSGIVPYALHSAPCGLLQARTS